MQKLSRLTEKQPNVKRQKEQEPQAPKKAKAKVDQQKWASWGVPSVVDVTEDDAITEAKKTSGLYLDKDFPPDDSSLGPEVSYQNRNCLTVWKRPSEFLRDPQMFVDGASTGDVVEGSISNSWFLGALAVIASREDLLQALCVSQHPEYGFYQFRFFKNNQWYIVTIDDLLPCFQTKTGLKLMSAHCSAPNEIWVPLIEKAYAKLLGSYSYLLSGWQTEAFVDLTGGVGERIEVADFSDKNNGMALWNQMKLCVDENWLMGCSAATSRTQDFRGLLKGRCYSILYLWEYAANDGSVHRLLQLRNPWKQREWTGKWNDTDSAWTQDALERVARETTHTFDANDGCFWIEYEDWKKYFTRLVICRLYDDMYGEQYKRDSIFSEWKDITAGGCKDHPTWKNNPQFGFSTEKKCHICISLVQEDYKVTQAILERPSPLDNTKRKTEPSLNKIGSTGMYHARHEVLFSHDFLPGKYIIVPSVFHPNVERRFILVLYSQDKGNVTLHQLEDPQGGGTPTSTLKSAPPKKATKARLFSSRTKKTVPLSTANGTNRNSEDNLPGSKAAPSRTSRVPVETPQLANVEPSIHISAHSSKSSSSSTESS